MSSSKTVFTERFEDQIFYSGSSILWTLNLSILSVILAFMYYYYKFNKPKKVTYKRIPGPKVNGIITNIIPLLSIFRNKAASNSALLYQMVNAYSHVFRKEGMWMFYGGFKKILILYKAETVEPILSSNENIGKGFEYEFITPMLKEGLLTSKKDKWRYRRKLLTPSFHFRILDEFIPIFNEQANIFASKITANMEITPWIDIAPLASLCTLDIICETAMGKKLKAQINSESPYVKALHQFCHAAIDRLLRPWLWPDFLYQRTKKGKEFLKNLKIMDDFTRQAFIRTHSGRGKTKFLLRGYLIVSVQFLHPPHFPHEKKQSSFFPIFHGHHFPGTVPKYAFIVLQWRELAKRNRRVTSIRVTSMVTASIGKAISAATVRRRLYMNGLYVRVPRVCVPLSVQSRGAGLKWCQEHGNWTVSDWGNVMFTDESRFILEPDDKRIRIWRKQGTRNNPQNIKEHHTFRGGSIMVLAGISLGYRTDVHIFKRSSVTAVRYRNEVLEPIVRLYAAAIGPAFVLMNDNARPHRADIIDDYLESEGIARMAWPAYSSDLNPIENLWDALGRAHLQPLLLSRKLLYKKNGNCLILRWLTA
ncbi:cytochrome P450 4V2 [Trichonephila clavipes]|nr:cytochrome P450 4V2 [Trichonephila clavipes]